MIIECSHCESKVDAEVLKEHAWDDKDCPPFKVSLLKCPVCHRGLLSGQEYFQTGPDDWEWLGTRLWPEPEKSFHWSLPESVRNPLEEAERCFRCKAYSACAVMCGKALEGICLEFKTKDKILGRGLKELLDRQIIDTRIYDWGNALRKYRNIGAHVSGEKVSREDALDLLDFAKAICDYIFVLAEKFKDFMKRKKIQTSKKANDTGPVI